MIFLLVLSLVAALFSYVSLLRDTSTASQAVNPTLAANVTVVLDAGHGGEDGGASADSGVLEKDLNLQVTLLLAQALRTAGVNVILTRNDDRLLYDPNSDYQGRKKVLDLQERRKIAEATENCIFVSIHMNAYPLPQYNGLQVWYSPNNPESELLAKAICETVRENLQPENHREIKRAGSSIYLLYHLTCPAVLVECGFLSNAEDAALLSTPEYQKALAQELTAAILESLVEQKS